MALTTKVLIVAGTDPTGGAGIVRDIETASYYGVKASLAVTSVNVQDDRHVAQKMPVDADIVEGQMLAALKSNEIGAIKVGMTGNASNVNAICDVLLQFPTIPVVLDPVITASSGGALADDQTIQAIKNRLMTLSTIITPNLAELARLNNRSCALNHAEAIEQGKLLVNLGCSHVLVKGGHEKSQTSIDSLVSSHSIVDYSFERLNAEMRGTGCALSTAIACNLAHKKPITECIRLAKEYVYHLLEKTGTKTE